MSKLRYLELWQQKRNELPVTTDPQMDWLDMQSVLDIHMPVATPSTDDGNNNGDVNGAGSAPGSSAGTTGSNLVSELSTVIKAKLLYAVLAVTVAAAVTYYVIKKTTKPDNKPDRTEVRKDSLLNETADSLKLDGAVLDTAALIDNGFNQEMDSVGNDPQGENKRPVQDKTAETETDNPSAENKRTSDNNATAKAIENRSARSASSKFTNDNKPGTENRPVGNKPSTVWAGIGSSENSKNRNVRSAAGGSTIYRPTSRNRNKNDRSKRDRPNSQIKPFTSDGRDSRYANENTSLNDRLATVDQRTANRVSQRVDTRNFNANSNGLLLAKRYNSKTELVMPAPPLNFEWQKTLSTMNSDGKPAIIADHDLADHLPKALKKPEKTTSAKTVKASKARSSKSGNGFKFSFGNFDVGVLAGLGTGGEKHGGLLIAYNFNDKWALGTQFRVFTPSNISGAYISPNKSIRDTLQTLLIKDSRKIHTADLPLYLQYQITPNINLKGGVILTIPLKQTDGSTTFNTNGPRTDTSAYYTTVTNAVNQTSYNSKPNVSFTGGVGVNYNRWFLDVNYVQGLQPLRVSSTLGGYNFTRKNVQVSIGFKLNKPKRR